MKLKDFSASRPVNSTVTPTSPQMFTVGVRGVESIETCDGGVIVTLVPGDGDERTKGQPAVRLFVCEAGAGVVDG